MQPLLPSERMLARHVITAAGVREMSVVTVDYDGVVTVEPFTHETPNTVWTNADIVLLRPEALTEFLMDDLERMVSLGIHLTDIYAYLNTSALLATPGTKGIALPLNELKQS